MNLQPGWSYNNPISPRHFFPAFGTKYRQTPPKYQYNNNVITYNIIVLQIDNTQYSADTGKQIIQSVQQTDQ